MASTPAGWITVPISEYESFWTPFDVRYSFRASMDPKGWPAIAEPDPSVTFDLSGPSDDFGWAATSDRLNAEALIAFRAAFRSEPELVVLDWQHPVRRMNHHVVTAMSEAEADEFNLPTVYPDGDYFAFMTADMKEGTFGHPWEKTLCVIGARLEASLVPALDRWLPRKRTNGRA